MIVRSVKDLGALVQDRRKQLGGSLWVSQFEAGKTTAHVGLVMRTLRALELELQVWQAPSSKSGAEDSSLVDLDALLEGKLNRLPNE